MAASTPVSESPAAMDDNIIRPGDQCILQVMQSRQLIITVTKGAVIQTRHGALQHDSLIGIPFGSKVNTKNDKGFVWVLRLTPELWTVNLRHRTQVIYHHDISLIVMMLDLKPEHIVLEAGTGSGSLSHALIRAVSPHGHLFTYDFHKERAGIARKEFDEHGIGEHVTCTHADVVNNGFGLENMADAVVLDLPTVHQAVGHARKAMKVGARICSFSPCIEQVQRMCAQLHSEGFHDIRTFECGNRELQPTTVSMPRPKFTCQRRTMTLKEGDRDEAAGSSSTTSEVRDSEVAILDETKTDVRGEKRKHDDGGNDNEEPEKKKAAACRGMRKRQPFPWRRAGRGKQTWGKGIPSSLPQWSIFWEDKPRQCCERTLLEPKGVAPTDRFACYQLGEEDNYPADKGGSPGEEWRLRWSSGADFGRFSHRISYRQNGRPHWLSHVCHKGRWPTNVMNIKSLLIVINSFFFFFLLLLHIATTRSIHEQISSSTLFESLIFFLLRFCLTTGVHCPLWSQQGTVPCLICELVASLGNGRGEGTCNRLSCVLQRCLALLLLFFFCVAAVQIFGSQRFGFVYWFWCLWMLLWSLNVFFSLINDHWKYVK